jgi:TonB family protein
MRKAVSTMSGVSILVTFLINAIWQVAVVAAAGWLASRFLKRLGPRVEHVGWVATLGIAIAAPAAPLLRRLLDLIGRQSFIGGHSSVVTVTATYDPAGLGWLHQLPVPALWTMAALYFFALIYFAGRFAWSLHCTRRMFLNAQPLILTPEQEEIWSRCKRLFALDRVRIVTSAEISGPVVLGFKETILVVPDEFAARCTLPDLMTALAHECAHAERRDFKKNLCYEAASLILAFHPAIWVIKAQIAQTREMVCDSMVAERVMDARAYAQSLLRLAGMVATSPRSATVNAIGIFDANILEKRIMMMNRKIRHYGFVVRHGLIVPAVLLLASSWIVVAAKAVVIEPAATAGSEQAGTSGRVYKVGNGVSAPVPLHTIDAEFPKSGLKIKAPFSEIVLVRLVVDKDGKPQDVHVSTSFKPDFDREAVKAVKQYQFKPAMRLGEPVPVALTVEVNFKKY